MRIRKLAAVACIGVVTLSAGCSAATVTDGTTNDADSGTSSYPSVDSTFLETTGLGTTGLGTTGLGATGLGATGLETTGPGSQPHVSTVTTVPPTRTVSELPTTIVTTPTEPQLIPPPPTTPEPAPTSGDCPYLKNAQVKDANGQHTGPTSIIDLEPYPVCLFTRLDGHFLAATRIVVADTPEEATAAVNQHVPIDKSSPATHPSGWSGGAMGNLSGVPGYPDAASIYAVSKGTIAVIAISNQPGSIKGRQMVTDIVQNLDL